jgi:hypothetical protein
MGRRGDWSPHSERRTRGLLKHCDEILARWRRVLLGPDPGRGVHDLLAEPIEPQALGCQRGTWAGLAVTGTGVPRWTRAGVADHCHRQEIRKSAACLAKRSRSLPLFCDSGIKDSS